MIKNVHFNVDIYTNQNTSENVAPFVGVWIEIIENEEEADRFLSLPSWECGLKSYEEETEEIIEESLPSWECGLKSNEMKMICLLGLVAPFVGVWIEISIFVMTFHNLIPSLPSWECGLKSGGHITMVGANSRRSLRGSVD